MRLLLRKYGPDVPVGSIAVRLRCKACKVAPAEVWLNETHNRKANGGGAPGCSVQLIAGAAA